MLLLYYDNVVSRFTSRAFGTNIKLISVDIFIFSQETKMCQSLLIYGRSDMFGEDPIRN